MVYIIYYMHIYTIIYVYIYSYMTGQGASKAVLGHDPMPGQIASYIMRANIGWRRPS